MFFFQFYLSNIILLGYLLSLSKEISKKLMQYLKT